MGNGWKKKKKFHANKRTQQDVSLAERIPNLTAGARENLRFRRRPRDAVDVYACTDGAREGRCRIGRSPETRPRPRPAVAKEPPTGN